MQLPLPLLPLRGSVPLTGVLACLTPACWSTPGVGLEGSCCVLFLSACSVHCFPCCRLPWGFRVTGGLYFCFPGGVGWASALPFFFWASPAPPACWGSWGFCSLCQRAPVAVLSAWFAGGVPLLPYFFHYLRVVCFWPTVSQEFVGCEGGLSCPSWFVILFLCLLVLHLFWSWGGFWSQVGGPSCDSWFWTLLMLGHTFMTP